MPAARVPGPPRFAAVVPAAGRGRRLGGGKLLLPYGGGTVVGATVEALAAAGAEPIVLVVAPGDARLAAWGQERGIRVAVNPAPARGMLSSIQAGVEALGAPEPGRILLVCPADHPALRAGTVAAVLAPVADGRAKLAVPRYRGRRGHPLAIAAELIGEIAGLDPAVGLRQLLRRHPEDLLEVAVDDPGAVADLDTPEDYRRLAEPQG